MLSDGVSWCTLDTGKEQGLEDPACFSHPTLRLRGPQLLPGPTRDMHCVSLRRSPHLCPEMRVLPVEAFSFLPGALRAVQHWGH